MKDVGYQVEQGVDLVLSSGFLAFARHLGFLKAVEDSKIKVNAICGTSSGAMIASLWAAGHSVQDIRDQLTQKKPLEYLKLKMWGGLFSLQPMVKFLEEHLPTYIEDLTIPIGISVVTEKKQHQILMQGRFAESVAASCAVPYLFQAISIQGQKYQDGGVADRLGLEAWRNIRPQQFYCVHQVKRSKGKDLPYSTDHCAIVHSNRSYAKLWDLGPFDQQIEESYQQGLKVLQAMNTDTTSC